MISHTCQEIHDIKKRRRPKSIAKIHNYTNTIRDEGKKTSQNCTQVPDSNSSARESINDEDGSGDTYSLGSKLYHCEPNSPDTPSHHAPTPPSLNPAPSESTPMLPGDLFPSPASRIETATPSSPSKLARKACNTALSTLVHTSPSSPCAAWNVLLWPRNGLEESEEESGIKEESSLLMGERGGELGVGGLCPEQGRGMGMVIDKEGGAKADHNQSGIGCPSPLQVQQRKS